MTTKTMTMKDFIDLPTPEYDRLIAEGRVIYTDIDEIKHTISRIRFGRGGFTAELADVEWLALLEHKSVISIAE